MGELKIDVNKDGLGDRVSWYWHLDQSGNYYKPIPKVEIATGPDTYVLLSDLKSLKYDGREYKVGDHVAKANSDDIDRRIYSFEAGNKAARNASGKWEDGLQLYLKIEPVVDSFFRRRSQRELGVVLLHPELFKDEPEYAAMPGLP